MTHFTPQELLRNAKKTTSVLTPLQKRRADYDRLIASLAVPKNISIGHVRALKARPATGAFASA